MINGDGGGRVEEVKAKWCPLKGDWCTSSEMDRCALSSEMHKVVGGIRQVFKMCSFNALVILLSEINAKAVGQSPQKIVLPKLYKG